jgi:hypothetical protein
MELRMADIVDMAAKVAQNPPPPTHRIIQPAPLPTVFNVGQADVNGQNFVLLQVTTPGGQAIYFLDGNAAEDVGAALIRLGQASKAGLVVP